jgi:MarR-like DNA-binding transcriptional regulator SgrR of sgrS sRNA
MRLRACLWLALSSFPAGWVWGETRPHYGGALNAELSSTFSSLEPSEMPAMIWPLVAQTLVRVNSRGDLEPLLASAWQREADGRRWRISLRAKVVFHDGEALNAASVAPILLAALKKSIGEVAITAGGSTMVIQADHPLPNLLWELADPSTAIVRKNEANAMIGTGPFRVATWEPGRKLALSAFEDYWGGRPYLDSIAFNLGSTRSTADLFDVPFASPRRILPEGARVWQSAPHELLAVQAIDVQPALFEALALTVDRSSIVNVLAQRRGTPAFGLLPQWLSGYEFLFRTDPSISRARQLVSQARPSPLTLAYSPGDSFARAVAERIALNARDAGITVLASASAAANLKLVRWPIETTDATAELARLARLLGLADRAAALDPAKPETLYQAERSLMENHVIPLAHLASVYGLASRVHFKDAGPNATIPHLEDFWVDP